MNRRAELRRQGGFTLLELLIALVVGTIVVVPTMAWITLTYRQHAMQTATARADNLVSLTRATFGRDVVSANTVALSTTDCTPPPVSVVAAVVDSPESGPEPPPATPQPGSTMIPVLSLGFGDNGTTASRTVYLVATGADSAGGTLVRHRCDATGALVDEQELGGGLVEPSAGWQATASCGPRPGYPGDDCGRVSLTLTSRGRTDALVANLRTGPLR